MRLRGINYDTGFAPFGSLDQLSRPSFNPEQVRNELAIIARDLHCTAVRISGRDIDRLVLAAEAASSLGLEVWFSPFPTELSSAELVKYFRAAVECIAAVNRVVGLDIQLLDLGGGFPAPYASPGTTLELNGLREALEALLGTGGGPRVVVESGRYLSATSGTLLATVRDIKSTSGGTRFVVLDAGVNHLGGMSALRRLPPVVAVPVTSAGDESPERPARLVGPLCTPLDVLNLRAMLPEGLAIGDVVAIPNVGAYGLTASLIGFLSRDLPCEVVVDGGRLVEATRLNLTRAACEED